jgi:esterase/lipase superfamily enzyme
MFNWACCFRLRSERTITAVAAHARHWIFARCPKSEGFGYDRRRTLMNRRLISTKIAKHVAAFEVVCLACCILALVGCSENAPEDSRTEQAAPVVERTPTLPGESIEFQSSSAHPSSRAHHSGDSPSFVPKDAPALPSLNGPKPLLPSRKESTSNSTTDPQPPAQLALGPVLEPFSQRTKLEAFEPLDVEQTAPASSELLLGNRVDVYFATDRLPTAELLPSPLRNFAPAAIVSMLACAILIGFSGARRFQALWLIGSGIAVCLCLIVLQASIIRWQQYSRLASNATTRFSTLRFEATTDYPLHVGMATVSLPEIHQPGGFESPSVFRLEFTENPEKHIILQSLSIEDSSDAWFEKLAEQMDSDQDREGFIFIHGYNVKFGDAIKRTAQLTYDLDIQGPSICYSWPSRGQVLSYAADEASVSWSAPHFEQLILDLKNRASCKHINIVAHSMGNRALLQALERLQLRKLTPNKLINTLVLAAPDVDAQEFESRYSRAVQEVAVRTSLYFSDRDIPLLLSNGIHQSTRLGFAANLLPRLEGIEAIHIGEQPLFTLGHSYYGSDVAVIDDMRSLLRDEKTAGERQFLRSTTAANGAPYWQIDRALHAKLSSANLR